MEGAEWAVWGGGSWSDSLGFPFLEARWAAVPPLPVVHRAGMADAASAEPAGVPPRQPAKDLATADTASRGQGREMLDLLPKVVFLSDGQMEVERDVPPHTQTGRQRDGNGTDGETERVTEGVTQR